MRTLLALVFVCLASLAHASTPLGLAGSANHPQPQAVPGAAAAIAGGTWTTSSTTIPITTAYAASNIVAGAWVYDDMVGTAGGSSGYIGMVQSYSGGTLTLTATAANASAGSTDRLRFFAQTYPGCQAAPSTFGNIWYFDPVNGQSEAAMAASGSFTGTISGGTTLTVGTVTGTALAAGQFVFGSGVAANTKIVSGSGTTWVITPSQSNLGPIAMTTNGISLNPAVNPHQGDVNHPWGTNLGVIYQSSVPLGFPFALLNTGHGATGSSPIAPGDEILIQPGNVTGTNLSFNGFFSQNNPAVTLAAADPSNPPVFAGLEFAGTGGWVVKGIKIQGAAFGGYLLFMSGSGTTQASDIIIDHVTIQSADPATFAGWTQAQWAANAFQGIKASNTRTSASTNLLNCISVTNSVITGVGNAVNLFTPNSYLANNEISFTTGDLLDYAENNQIIYKNYLHDPICTVPSGTSICGGFHPDGMQGQLGNIIAGVPSGLNPGGPFNLYQNITIDGNTIVRQTGSAITAQPSFANYMQGIDAFDSQWKNVQVTNNILITGSCYGIAGLTAQTNSIIANNTALYDGYGPLPGGCAPGSSFGGVSHEAPEGVNDVIANTIATPIGSPFPCTVPWCNYYGNYSNANLFTIQSVFNNFVPAGQSTATLTTVNPASVTFTGNSVGGTLTITSTPSGYVPIGAYLSGTGVTNATQITAQLSGPAGGASGSTYTLGGGSSFSSTTVTAKYGVMVISGTVTGVPAFLGQSVVQASPLVVLIDDLGASSGGAGTYYVNLENAQWFGTIPTLTSQTVNLSAQTNNAPITSYDLTLAPSSPAAGIGDCFYAPPYNFNGLPRTCVNGHVDAGAY